MISHVIQIFSLIALTESAINCFVTKSGNYSINRWTEEKVSCPNTEICLTIIDYGYDTIEKQCGPPYINCTFQGITLPTKCGNSSMSLATCCCYGELCNGNSATQFPVFVFIVSMFSISFAT